MTHYVTITEEMEIRFIEVRNRLRHVINCLKMLEKPTKRNTKHMLLILETALLQVEMLEHEIV
jgi:hypothetical protein